MELMNENKKMQQLIGSTLRVGVMTACCIAILGGIYYLISHGSESIPDYYKFHEIYHLLRFSNEKHIVEQAYQEYLEMRSEGVWAKQQKYF